MKQLAGNPGKHKLNLREPAATGYPDCPPELNAAAKAEWDRVAPLLESMGILGSVDRAALAAYCSAYSLWSKAEAMLRKSHGLVVKGSKGFIVDPYIRISRDAGEQMRKFMVEFGMTPSSRSRIVGIGKGTKESNTFEDLAAEARAVQ